MQSPELTTGQAATLTGTVVVVDSRDLLAPGIERLRERSVDVSILPEGLTPAEAADAAADALVIIDGVMAFRAPEIDRLRDVRLIIRAGIGYDVIDVAAATRRGIWVANIPDYCADEVADHTMLLLLAATRRLDALAGNWRRARRWLVYEDLPPVHRPSGRTLGVVGMGRIGARVAARARAFGWRIAGYDAMLTPEAIQRAGAEPRTLDELFAESDAITLHCPLNAQTHHLVNAERLAATKPGVVIVNTSRGGLIDLEALDVAVVSGQVSAAGLDVLEDEPTPDRDRPILSRSNVLVTSHVAWYSVEARRDLALLCADEALRVLDGGRPRNAVNPEARP
jgi:lactate dehydrogenase-like 2-hydroxyacid dehydrogenase